MLINAGTKLRKNILLINNKTTRKLGSKIVDHHKFVCDFAINYFIMT